jgi:DNA-binding winged helix-turn-helix (wHTH) protein
MIHSFDDFELDEVRYELRRAGVPVKLEPKAFLVLAHLVRHRDRMVTRDELRERFRPGEFVTDSAVAHCVVKARQRVDDGGAAQRVIKTVHGHGYRCVAAVQARPSQIASSAVPPPPRPIIAEEAWPIPETAEPLAGQPQAGHCILEGERKQATVLAIGVKGIPALAQTLDPEVLPAVLRRLFDLMRAEVERLEGRVSLATGDVLRAAFGAPIAHGDHTVRALHAALGIQQAFAAFAHDLQRTQGVTLTLRMGLLTGPIIVEARQRRAHG